MQRRIRNAATNYATCLAMETYIQLPPLHPHSCPALLPPLLLFTSISNLYPECWSLSFSLGLLQPDSRLISALFSYVNYLLAAACFLRLAGWNITKVLNLLFIYITTTTQ